MADIESNIDINIDTSSALASLRSLQRQISTFQQTMSKTGAVSSAQLGNMQQNLVNSINSTGQFTASIQRVATTTESFTTALERNKLSMGQYFRFAGSQVTGFRKIFSTEFDTIDKVARERVKTLQTQYIKLGRDASGAMQAIAVRPQVLDMKDLGTQTAMTAQKAQLFNQLMKQGSTDLLNFGKNTQWAGRQLMVGFTIPLGIMGAAAAKEFKAIEEQVIRLERVYGDFTTTMADTDAITESVKALGQEFTKYGVAVSKTIGLAADAAAMGKTGADLVAQVAEANRLAVLGGVDQAQSLETTISLTNAFGVASDKLAGKINFLNAVENQTVTSIEDMTDAIPKAGPVVQQLGGNVEDLTFFLTAMKEGGINASEGANALKSGLASLINPSAEANEMLSGFGVNLQGIVDANKGNVKGIVVDFAKALDTLDPLNRAQAIEQLFGKFQFSRLSTLFQNVIAEGSQAQRVLQLTSSSSAELAALSERELSRIEESPLYKFEGAVERFKASMAPIGETFMKAVTPIIDFGTSLLESFNGWSDQAKSFTVILTGVVAGLGPILLMTFGLIANGVANVIKGFMAVRGMLDGTGRSSNVLAEQTNYMTTQQMEAAAVAASLGQVHNTLIQTFNAEAGSVRNLAGAYGTAIAAQGKFMGMPVGGKTKKFAGGGIFKGPGTGTSDSIAAMVSNGEAIIPAKTVKKFPDLISGLISGNIPGFASGKDPINTAFSKLRGAPSIVSNQTAGIDWSTKQAEQVALQKFLRTQNVSGTQSSNLMGTAASHIDPTKDLKDVKIGNVTRKVKEWLSGNLMADSQAVNQYVERLGQKVGGEVLDAFSDKKNVDAMAKKLNVTPAQVNKELKQLRSGYHPATKLGGQLMKEVADFDAASPQFGGKNKYYAGAAGAVLGARDMDNFYDPKQMKGRSYDKSKDAAAIESNRKRIEGYQRRVGAVVAENVKVEAVNAKQEKQTQAYKKSRLAAEKKFEEARAKLHGAEKGKLTRQREQWIAMETANIEEQRKATNREKAQTKRNQTQATATPKKTLKSRVGGVASRIGGAMSPGKLAGVGMMASMAAGGLSMVGGPVGDVAGAAAGPLAALTGVMSVMSMIPGPAGIAVAALGGLTAGIMYLNAEAEKAKQAARDQAQAVGTTSKAMDAYAAAAGTTNPLAIANAKRTEAGLTRTTEQTFGESYLQQDAGAAMLSGIRGYAGENGMADASKKMASQLSTAVATGILSSDQAESIAMAIGDQLKSESFSIGVIGQMTELVGPNGEKLKDQPLEVSIALAKGSEKELDKAMTKAVKAAEGPDLMAYSNATAPSTGSYFSASTGGVGTVAPTKPALATVTGTEAIDLISNFNSMQQQNQMILAAQDLQNESVIQQLESEGKIAEAKAKQLEYDKQRKTLTDQISASTTNFISKLKGLDQASRDKLVSESATQTKDVYKGTEMEATANKAVDTLSGGRASAEAKLTLNAELASGTLTPDQLNTVFGVFDQSTVEGGRSVNLLAKINTELGSGVTSEVANLLPMFGDDEVAAANFVATFDTKNPEEFKETTAMFTELQKVNPELNMSIYFDGSDVAQKKLEALTEAKKKMDELVANGPTTMETVISQVFKDDPAKAAAMRGNAEWFGSLPAAMQSTYIQAFITAKDEITGAEIDAEIAKGAKRSGIGPSGLDARMMSKSNRDIVASQLAASRARGIVEQYQAALGSMPSTTSGPANSGTPASSGSGGGGGASAEPEKPPTSFLDSIVKDLRDFTNTAQGLTENFQDSMSAIRSAVNNVFGGLSQQMRGLGAGEDVISLMAGMSKEDWDQYRGQFFNFDSAGNITGFKDDLNKISEKLRTITLAKFVNEQQKSIAASRDQSAALTKLVSLGMSYADAYKMVEDAALAAAIANATSADQIREIIKLSQQAAKARTIAEASGNVANMNASTDATNSAMEAVIKYNDALSDAQVSAIMASDDLQAMMANFSSLTPDQLNVLNEALRDADLKAEIELKVKMQTKEGMQEIFNDGFSRAMEQFSAKEQSIKIKFEALRNPFEDIISSFSNQIEDLKNTPGGLDDLEADLQRIGEQEIDINKKYDDRFKALDRIQQANEKIAQQQRSQLSLAEALSMGDIAAAARAADEMRSQQAAQALVDQREALQKSQQLELDHLTGQMGLTRSQLEERIRDLKVQIFEIEESQIEPAQRQIELLARQEELEINSLTVLGKTREEWEKIKSEIELARTTNDAYNESISLALDVANELIKKWKEIEKPKETIHTIIENRVDQANAEAARLAAEEAARKKAAAEEAARQAALASQQAAPSGPVKDDAWLNEMARRTYRGEFGNGQARKNALGGDYAAIQARVNRNYYAKGGMVASYLANGGFPGMPRMGTDTVPAMLTPGEFVVKKYAVDSFGADNLKAINNGTYKGGSVYNNTYSINVNARTNANPDEIARTVIAQIKQVDSQRIRGNRF